MQIKRALKMGVGAIALLTALTIAHSDDAVTENAPLSWEELPLAVEERLIAIDADPRLDHYHCATSQESDATRTMQVIEGTFYEWLTFDQLETDAPAYCLVMVYPVAGELTQQEAQVLLSASRLWLKPPLAQRKNTVTAGSDGDTAQRPSRLGPVEEQIDPGDLHYDAPTKPEIVPGLKAVIGADDRQVVSNVTAYPFNTIGYLSVAYDNGETFRGTAFLVAPRMALTNAHLLYDPDLGGFVDEVVFMPGRDGSRLPYGQHRAVDWRTNQAYVSTANTQEGFRYDFGAIFLANPVPGITTFMPLVFNEVPPIINLSGYPGEALGRPTQQQHYSGGEVVGVDDDELLVHRADASTGTSGAPVWRYNPTSGERAVVAIFSAVGTTVNFATRLTAENEPLIRQWLSEGAAVVNPAPPPPVTSGAGGLLGISTSARVSADGIIAAGFIITGSQPRTVALLGEQVASMDPLLVLTEIDSNGEVQLIDSNDDWRSAPNSSQLVTRLQRSPNQPTDAALLVTLNPGVYIAALADLNGRSGAQGNIQINDMTSYPNAASGNIIALSTNASIASNGEIAGGLIVRGGTKRYVILGENQGGMDPVLEFYRLEGNGSLTRLGSNDNWQNSPNSQQIVSALQRSPRQSSDAALIFDLPVGTYFAILRDRLNRAGAQGNLQIADVASF